tara:strand:+ start:281 stop:535 length:255 start_codon:yes stop_codon:yes gene_type:complete
MALKYDPDEFIKSEEKEQPTRRQAPPDETDFAVGQAKLDAIKNRDARGFLFRYGSEVDNIVKNLKAGRDPNQSIGSSANRSNYI